MTREEAIEIIEYARAFNEKNTLLMRALDMAVYCLRFQATFECQKDHFPDLTKMRPLALEQLREMDGEPVWVDDKKTWALLQVWDDDNIDAVFPMPRGCFHAESVVGKKIYRRPPEGEEINKITVVQHLGRLEDVALRPVSREQVEKVWRGEWEFPIFTDAEDGLDPRVKCSVCGNIEAAFARWKFCPNCGATITDEAVQMVMEIGDEEQ